MKDIYEILKNIGISYIKHDHPAVFTCEESKEKGPELHGGNTKNLFLRNKKGDRHYLVSLGHEKQADLKKLRTLLNEAKLSFGSPERLMEKLGLTPGSVSLLGLINNAEKDVIVIIDEDLWKHEVICCHPNVNTATLEIKRDDLKRFFDSCGNAIRFMDL